MAREDIDLVVHLGDYIYESSWGRNPCASMMPASGDARGCRNRYALCRRPRPAGRARRVSVDHHRDDHEVQNDYANDRSQNLDRATSSCGAARQHRAYYEHLRCPGACSRGPRRWLHGSITEACRSTLLTTASTARTRSARAGRVAATSSARMNALTARSAAHCSVHGLWLHDGRRLQRLERHRAADLMAR
jgi:hypothetical protein